MARRHWATSWRVLIAAVVVALPALALWYSTSRPATVLLIRGSLIIATNPHGGLWAFVPTSTPPDAVLVIYDAGGCSFIVTHRPQGDAAIQALASSRGRVPALRFFKQANAFAGNGAGPLGCSIILSFWWLLGAAALVSLWLAIAAYRRRVRTGCVQCGYPRSGLGPAASCPECGFAFTATTAS
jgi:hypothetical protein